MAIDATPKTAHRYIHPGGGLFTKVSAVHPLSHSRVDGAGGLQSL